MSTITIKRIYQWSDELPVKIDGICNHAGARERMTDDGKALVCKCGAIDYGIQEHNEDGKHTIYKGDWQ